MIVGVAMLMFGKWLFIGLALVAGGVAGTVGVINQAAALPASIHAVNGHGQPGSAVATSENCGSGTYRVCSWTGDYTSRDGTVRLRNIDLRGGGWHVGPGTPALYEGRSLFGPLVFRAGARLAWIGEALAMAESLVLAACGWVLVGCLFVLLWKAKWHRPRRSAHAATPPRTELARPVGGCEPSLIVQCHLP